MVAAVSFPLGRAFSNPADRRNGERLTLGCPVTIHFNAGDVRWTETDATLIDLSRDGMFIRADRVPRRGQRILLGLLHERYGLCAAWGRAVRYDGWGGFGVHFRRANAPLAELVGMLELVNPPQRAEVLGDADLRVWIETERLHPTG